MKDLPAQTLLSWTNAIAAYHDVTIVELIEGLPKKAADFVKAVHEIDGHGLDKSSLTYMGQGAKDLSSMYQFSWDKGPSHQFLVRALADHYILELKDDVNTLTVDRNELLKFLPTGDPDLLFSIEVDRSHHLGGVAMKYYASVHHGSIIGDSVCGNAVITIPLKEGFDLKPMVATKGGRS